jgi:hypothetical protein
MQLPAWLAKYDTSLLALLVASAVVMYAYASADRTLGSDGKVAGPELVPLLRLFLVTLLATFVVSSVFRAVATASSTTEHADGSGSGSPELPARGGGSSSSGSGPHTAGGLSIDDVMQHVDLSPPPF